MKSSAMERVSGGAYACEAHAVSFSFRKLFRVGGS